MIYNVFKNICIIFAKKFTFVSGALPEGHPEIGISVSFVCLIADTARLCKLAMKMIFSKNRGKSVTFRQDSRLIYKNSYCRCLMQPRKPKYSHCLSRLMIFLAGVFLVSCSDGMERLPLYTVETVDFEDCLMIEGETTPAAPINVMCPQEVDGTIAMIIESGTSVRAGDTLVIIEDANAESNFETRKTNLEAAEAELVKLEANLRLDEALLEAKLKNIEAETQLAELDTLQLSYLSPNARRIKELQIEKNSISRTQLLRQYNAQEALQKSDILKVKSRIARLRRRYESAEKVVRSLIIQAPKDGLVIRANSPFFSTPTEWKVGENAWYGLPLMIFPGEKHKVIFYATETEYKRLKVGDSISYTLDAMPDNLGWGKIVKMASAGKKRTAGSQVKTFEIEATIDSIRRPVESGMSVNCRVWLNHVPDVKVVPSVSVHDSEGGKVVYVRRDNHFEETRVRVGASTPSLCVLEQGVEEGDVISLIKPSSSMIRRADIDTTTIAVPDSTTFK